MIRSGLLLNFQILSSPVDSAFLCCFAFLAGFIDAVVGGGGLIQTPALLLFLPPQLSASIPLVFGTNKLASLCGTSVATIQYARHIQIPWRSIGPAAFIAFLFSFLGAHAVALIRNSHLRPVILILLTAVAIYTFWKKDLGQLHAPRLSPQRERLAGLLMGAGLGFYDGFFGPGTGSFLILILIGGFGFDFLIASASAKTINLMTNLAAVLYFASHGHVAYQYALPMGASNMLGSAVGSRLAILKGNRFVRGFFLIVVSMMILRLAWDTFRNP